MVKYALVIAALSMSCKGGDKQAPFGGTASGSGSAAVAGGGAGTGSGSAATPQVATNAPAGSGSGSAAADPWATQPSNPLAPSGKGSGSAAGSGAGSGSAQPAPPSTGNEMPKQQPALSPEQAKAIVDAAVARFAQPNPPCDQIVAQLGVALPIAVTTLDASAIPALTTYGKCAQMTKRWRASIRAATALLEAGDDNINVPPAIVRALSEMGEYDKAIQTAVELAKKYPKSSDLLLAAVTMVFCKAEAWDKCVSTSEKALAELAKNKADPNSDAVAVVKLMRSIGWIVTGKPTEALEEIAAIEKVRGPTPKFDEIKSMANRAIERGFHLEIAPLQQLPIGVYHLMGRANTGALVTLKLREQGKIARQFRVEVEVPGVTEKSSNTLSLAANEWSVKWANPPLKMDFDLAKIRGPRPAQLSLKITELAKGGDKVIIDETLPIEVLPRDYLPLKRKVGADSFVPTFGYMGAWLTSNDPAIDTFLTKAKERAPNRNFVGEQGPTIPQIKALYDELKSRGVSYVMDPNVAADQVFVQRTRLPSEVLASTNAQCLEGTLLFATLFEAIGIKPIIVVVPGHAFVGWHTVAKDGTKGEPLFVETTMVGVADFEAAVRVATQRVQTEMKQGSFKAGASTLIDVPQIISQGFTAQPL